MSTFRLTRGAAMLVASAVVLAGCAARGGVRYVPSPADAAGTLPAGVIAGDYLLNVGDEVQIDVQWHPELTSQQAVRQDGKITAVGLGEVMAAGHSTAEVDSALTILAARQYRDPEVTVLLRRGADLVFYVAGDSKVGGSQKWVPGMRALQALGVAAGSTDLGQLGTVLLVKRHGPNGQPIAYRLSMKRALGNGGVTDNPPVDPYDILWIPRSPLASASLKMTQLFNLLVQPANMYLKGWEVSRNGVTKSIVERDSTITIVPLGNGGGQ